MKEDSRNNAEEVKGSLSQVPALSDQPIELFLSPSRAKGVKEEACSSKFEGQSAVWNRLTRLESAVSRQVP
ncbi:hypothetical protein KQX54_009973 [Cotesia glomerata]|uniref:Uncharacterized protein n=1 Tax=Cotesia glomerata TaxID=32391 RepID=A0AAV7IB80_COTGL|nr:hypothetical protein KQX54_009973 [Cotesia glomerata]